MQRAVSGMVVTIDITTIWWAIEASHVPLVA
jgi:hypothetical protein